MSQQAIELAARIRKEDRDEEARIRKEDRDEAARIRKTKRIERMENRLEGTIAVLHERRRTVWFPRERNAIDLEIIAARKELEGFAHRV